MADAEDVPPPPPPPEDNLFTWRRVLVLLALSGFVLGALFLSGPDAGPQTDTIIISVNSMRTDHLSCYGYHRNTTPEICSIAEDGIHYTDANAQRYWTTPSEASIHTGLYPEAHGLMLAPGPDRSRSLVNTTTIAEAVRDAGYNTRLHALIDTWTYPNGTGLLAGYETVAGKSPLRDLDSLMGSLDGPDPSFTYIHSKSLHRPYNSISTPDSNHSAWYSGKLRDIGEYDELPSDFVSSITYTGDGYVAEYDGRRIALTDEDIRYIRDEYDDTLTHIDGLIGGLVDRLREQGAYRSSLIIITAPHGESLGEPYRGDGGFGHGTGYEEVEHVPLIIKPPGDPGPITVDEQVQLIDIYPTIMDVLDLPVPDHVQGHSILPPTPSREYTFMGKAIIMNKSWKLFGSQGQADEPLLYDMRAPPEDRQDVSDQYPTITDMLQAAKADWQERNRVLHSMLTDQQDTGATTP